MNQSESEKGHCPGKGLCKGPRADVCSPERTLKQCSKGGGGAGWGRRGVGWEGSEVNEVQR